MEIGIKESNGEIRIFTRSF